MFLTTGAVNKKIKKKKFFSDNHFHNSLRLFNVLPIFFLTTTKLIRDYYL